MNNFGKASPELEQNLSNISDMDVQMIQRALDTMLGIVLGQASDSSTPAQLRINLVEITKLEEDADQPADGASSGPENEISV